MRLLYVVQRYGDAVAGGAEQHARELAERLVSRGHAVEVLTTCATSYVDWENVLDPGQSVVDGVVVHRVPVLRPRNGPLFGEFNARMMHAPGLRPLTVQRDWLTMEGPHAPGIPRWLRHRAADYDAVVFITYLYWTAWAGLRAVAGTVPTVLHPTAHDEPPLRYSVFNDVFRLPDAFAFLTPEEAELVHTRFPGAPAGDVVGVGVDLDHRGDGDEFRARRGIGDAPYLLYLGRVDPAKGASELLDYFLAYKELNGGPLKLVFLGEALIELPDRDDVVVTGFVDSRERDAALAGALALAHPSYFESFSMALTESFAQSRPAIVQERCAVMAGHARRSGGAVPYSGFAEFEAAVGMLTDEPGLADELGRRGRAYVERNYAWPVVLERYERLLERVRMHDPRRSVPA
jgi:glycosyltransferase involved in cell wall biosynthesis